MCDCRLLGALPLGYLAGRGLKEGKNVQKAVRRGASFFTQNAAQLGLPSP